MTPFTRNVFVSSRVSEWLIRHNVPGLYGIDTRELTKTLRVKGVMLGKIVFPNQPIDFYDPNQINLVAHVSRDEPQHFGDPSGTKITCIDCGIKNNIIRFL